jgi:hypothetical protein
MPLEGTVPIPALVKDELLSLALLFNHVQTDLHAPVSCLVGATDAASDGLGAAEARVTQTSAQYLLQRADIKGDRVRLGAVLEGKRFDAEWHTLFDPSAPIPLRPLDSDIN